ncbi:MAG: hypothetical protein AAF390_10290 [Pseudomonadota bacterium]
MIRRGIGLMVAALAFAVLFYASRYWPLRLWERGEMFGLPPQGGLVGQWVRGTPLAPFELILWGIGSILVLTGLRKLLER